MTTYTYPGIFVQEQKTKVLSISSAPTSVPVFACVEAEYGLLSKKTSVARAAALGRSAQPLQDSNSDFNSTADDLGASLPVARDADALAPSFYRFNSMLDVDNSKLVKTEVIYLALRAYFENGGGYCYVVKTADLSKVVPTLAEVSLLVAAGQDIKAAATALCNGANKYLFGILDVPAGKDLTVADDLDAANTALGSLQHTAAYYPWLKAEWAGAKAIPPSAAVAGVYCSVDRDRGVWKAPANVQLQGGLVPEKSVSDTLQGASTLSNAINMIRQIGDRTTVVWGARTRASSTEAEWVHIPVRRLFNSIEKDLRDALGKSLFEPNNESTWDTARTAVSNYLHRLWIAGALQGGSDSEAYFVQIGKGVTMTEDDIRGGKLIINIGVAPARPAEFIVLSMTQDVMPG